MKTNCTFSLIANVVSRILTAFCNNVTCLKSSLVDIIVSIGPLLNAQISQVSFHYYFPLLIQTFNNFQANLIKLKQQIKGLLNFLISSKENTEKISFDSELNSLADMLPPECASLVKTTVMLLQVAVDLETKKTISRNDLDRFL